MSKTENPPPVSKTDASCLHQEWLVGYDHCQCKQCGSIKTDGGWGIASRTWFKSRAEAVFFQKNGRMPDPLPSPETEAS